MPLHHSKNPKLLFRDVNRFKKDIPRIAGGEALRFFKQAFRDQGWKDMGTDKWKPRKRNTGRRTDNRGILIKSGALKRSVRIVRYTRNAVIISSELPYAKIHNEGGKITGTQNVKSHSRRTSRGRSNVRTHTRTVNTKIPRRKFMGQSATLDDIIVNALETRLRQILR